MSNVLVFVSSCSEQNAGLLSIYELPNAGFGSGHGLPSGLDVSQGSDSNKQDLLSLQTYSEVVKLGLRGDSSTSNPENQSRTDSVLP